VSGDQSPQAAKAQQFAEELRAQVGLTVHLWGVLLTAAACVPMQELRLSSASIFAPVSQPKLHSRHLRELCGLVG
jgi:hypothetical protein